jgi:hypothetical protein
LSFKGSPPTSTVPGAEGRPLTVVDPWPAPGSRWTAHHAESGSRSRRLGHVTEVFRNNHYGASEAEMATLGAAH